jgi:hypothetical protein
MGGNVNFNNLRLDELLKHAKDCAAIGRPDLVNDYLHKAVGYGKAIGVRVPHDVQRQIISQARESEVEMERTFAEIESYYSQRK